MKNYPPILDPILLNFIGSGELPLYFTNLSLGFRAEVHSYMNTRTSHKQPKLDIRSKRRGRFHSIVRNTGPKASNQFPNYQPKLIHPPVPPVFSPMARFWPNVFWLKPGKK